MFGIDRIAGRHPALTATNTSDRMFVFWGWLTDDPFTHQRASYVRRDANGACDLWRRSQAWELRSCEFAERSRGRSSHSYANP